MELPSSPGRFVNEQLSKNDLDVMPIYLRHVLGVYELPGHHHDPFDRLLISQALLENVPILSVDPEISRYPVEVIW